MICVLIVDDSITQREILKRVLEADGEFVVAGEARDGRQAVDMVRETQPDVVVMDIHMPEMDGIEATRQIMSQCPVPIVIASATLKRRDVDHGLKAMEAGAVSVITKPGGAALLHLKEIAPDLRHEIIAASRANVTKSRLLAGPSVVGAQQSQAIKQHPHRIELVGVCASTGGPSVLSEIFSALPKPFPVPILLVQHISQGFVEGFGEWLGQQTGHVVQMATEGQRLEPGIWLAPAGRHLALAGPRRLALPRRKTSDVHCPSGDPLFESLARHLGPKAAGVQLTGMGDDGARGLLALKQAGGETFIQSEATSLIWRMPKVAQELGAANHELSPASIAHALTRLTTQGDTQGQTQ